jgi:hypothetical protein
LTKQTNLLKSFSRIAQIINAVLTVFYMYFVMMNHLAKEYGNIFLFVQKTEIY